MKPKIRISSRNTGVPIFWDKAGLLWDSGLYWDIGTSSYTNDQLRVRIKNIKIKVNIK